MRLLAGGGEPVLEQLLDRGLQINPRAKSLLLEYLHDRPPQSIIDCVDRIGWCDRIFVLPDDVIPSGARIVFQPPSGALPDGYRTQGTVESWRNEIARLAVGNPLMVLVISAAFAGPLLAKVNSEGGGIHLFGPSSCGKTTLLHVASSVWGEPARFMRSWRATANGLEAIAAQHNDCLFAVDEIAEIAPHDLAQVAYFLGNGKGKQRSNRYGFACEVQQWRCAVISCGERDLGSVMSESRLPVKAGQELRLLPLFCERRYGVFDELHGFPDGRALSDHLKAACSQHHGVVIRELIRRLIDETDLNQALNRILDQPEFSAPDGQAGRAARRFATFALAGELATSYGLTDWQSGLALESCGLAYRLWLERRGSARVEETQVLEAIRSFIETFGDSRFTDVEAEEARASFSGRAGWWKDTPKGRLWLFTAQGLKDAVPGHDTKFVLDCLERHGLLVARSKVIRVAGRTARVHEVADL